MSRTAFLPGCGADRGDVRNTGSNSGDDDALKLVVVANCDGVRQADDDRTAKWTLTTGQPPLRVFENRIGVPSNVEAA